MAMSAAEQNANIPGMMQDQQNQRYMLQLQIQMQQNANPQNMHHVPPSVGGSGPAATGHGQMKSEDVGAGGLLENVSAATTGQMSAVSARKSVGNVGSPQLVPQQGSPVGGASTGSKKPAAKPKAKRNSKKSAKNALPSASTSAAATNAMARSHSMSGNIDGGGAMAAHPRGGISGVAVNPAILGNIGGGQPATSNTSSSSAGSSIVSSSPALAIKATSTPSAGGIGSMPVANNVTVAPSAGLGSTGTSPSFSASTGALSIGISGQAEPDGRPPVGGGGGGGSMAGFGENTFSALLSQKGNRVAMQSTHGGGSGVGGGAVASDLASAMNALGGVGGIDANELSLHLSEWLNDSSADALNNILSMGAAMGAGDVGGDHGNGGVLGSDAVTAAAAFSSFMAGSGGNGNGAGGAGGFPGALGMPSMGNSSGIGASNISSVGGVSGGMAVPIPGVGGGAGGGAGKIGEASNAVNMVFSSPAAPGNKSM
ncbi:hypothetical protein LPJ72_003744 [Coemansia sp. Benny D160-2]|nr:hypothetical protein LPJ72_003744 [Coemansia sp. Benny D160-2]